MTDKANVETVSDNENDEEIDDTAESFQASIFQASTQNNNCFAEVEVRCFEITTLEFFKPLPKITTVLPE